MRSAACLRVIRFRQSGQYLTLLEVDAKNAPHSVHFFENYSMDMLCFDAACERIENYIGYRLAERMTEEIQTVKDNRVILDNRNATKIIHIKDMDTKICIRKFVFDRKTHSIYFIDLKTEGHNLFIKYKAGFTKETLPQNLKLAVVKLFLHTKTEVTKLQNGETTENNIPIPNDVKNILDEYRKARL